MNFELPKISLSAMSFDLPPHVGMPDVKRLKRLEQEIEDKIILGQSSARNARGVAELESRLRAGAIDPEVVITKPRDIRILLGWWRTSKEAMRALPFHEGFVTRFKQLRPRLSTQALFGLVELYFEQFDYLPDIKVVANYLKNQLTERRRKLTSARFRSLVDNADLLFDIRAPQRIAVMALKNKATLASIVEAIGLSQERKGRFYERCQQIYYIETLSKLKVGEEHRILSELAKKSVYETPYQQGFLLGHEVIRRIVDKAEGRSELPDNWLHLLLEIGGDPRVHQSSRRFTHWWGRLDLKYINIARRWLSRMDLAMFLEILEDYSNESGPDMRRMFPARKRFLKGLFESDLIKDSRLYLSRYADLYVRRRYKGKEMPAFAVNDDSDRSVLYVNVNGYHIFEGTHNFYFWIYKDLPEKRNPVGDYKTRVFSIRNNLGVGLNEALAHETGKQAFHVSHNGDWQHKVMNEFKRLGIKINAESVLEPNEYRVYKRRYGI